MKQLHPKSVGVGRTIPPQKNHVIIYFIEKGLSEKQAIDFFSNYNQRGWRNLSGNIIANWKTHAWEWVWTVKHQVREKQKRG